MYLIFLPFCPSLLALTNRTHTSCLTSSPRGLRLSNLYAFCTCHSFYLECLASSYSSFRAQRYQIPPPLTLLPLPQQSWSLLPLCNTLLHAKTYFLSSRSWSLSAKQGGSCPAPASSSSKGGCATEAICRWHIGSK